MNNQSQFQSPIGRNYVNYGQNYASPQLPTTQGSPCYTPTYNTPPTYYNLTGSDQFLTILKRLEMIDKRLSQLDAVENSVKSINVRLDKLDSKVTNLEKTVTDIERSREFDTS